MSLLLAFALAQIEIEASQRSCTLEQAERITFETAIAEGRRLNRRCVALRGIWSGPALYRSSAHARLEGAVMVAANERDRVGLMASERLVRRSPRPDDYLVVGILYDCSVFAGEMVGGYCHYHLRGPFIAMTFAYRRHWPTIRGLW